MFLPFATRRSRLEPVASQAAGATPKDELAKLAACCVTCYILHTRAPTQERVCADAIRVVRDMGHLGKQFNIFLRWRIPCQLKKAVLLSVIPLANMHVQILFFYISIQSNALTFGGNLVRPGVRLYARLYAQLYVAPVSSPIFQINTR